MNRFIIQVLGSLLLFQIMACGGGSGGNDVEPPASNASPISNAGIDQNAIEQTVVTLSGSGTDSDGSIVSYLWRQTQGVSVSLTNENTEVATFTSPEITSCETLTLSFELIVTDNENLTASDIINVTVSQLNTAPTSDAGASQFVTSGDTVNLNANGSIDSECDSLTYVWMQVGSTDITITLDDIHAASPVFTAPELTASQTISFELTVTDGGDLFDTSTVNVAISPVILQKINDTGITYCSDYPYDVTRENCDNLVDSDGDPIPDGQDADYGRDKTANDNSDGIVGFSFTKLDINGNPLPNSANTWSCVLDNVTSLIWELKSSDEGLQYIGNTYTWYDPEGNANDGDVSTQNGGVCTGSDCDTSSYLTSINVQGICGENDWRLPNIEELTSIIDYSQSFDEPHIDTDYFPNARSTLYWSSLPYASNIYSSWVVWFANGEENERSNLHPASIRLVRKKNE